MNTQLSREERAEFSERLRTALAAAKFHPTSPTQLSRAFNVIYGGKPISVHGARKWLVGEAIPTQEKLRDLAAMLGVSRHWLRFGDMQEGAAAVRERMSPATLGAMATFDELSGADQGLVIDFIRMLRRRAKVQACAPSILKAA